MRPKAIVVGFIGKLPFAGMSLYNLHYIAGLRDLGYDVHYVERQNNPDELYDPVADEMTDDPSHALAHIAEILPKFGIPNGRFSFIDRHDRCLCTSWSELRAAIDHADFIMTLCERAWCDEFAQCPRRVFVDGDPLFTQAAMLAGDGKAAGVLANYDTLFTYGTRIGMNDCTIPAAGRNWIPTRPVAATRYWNVAPASASSPISGVSQWTGGKFVELDGRTYGYKNREYDRFIELPQRASERFSLAVGGSDAPLSRLREFGWELVEPLEISGTIEAYQNFISGSRADLGIVKHAYVASRSGWFSDRSTCYLAAGRPVLHQDTGFGDWLPTGTGVLAFSNMEDLLSALDRLNSDYATHAVAARAIAEEYFEATKVVGRMLDDGGLR
ncbi:MAG: hypothetical protein ABIR58_03210 [Gemmatimonadaceae bacterium]